MLRQLKVSWKMNHCFSIVQTGNFKLWRVQEQIEVALQMTYITFQN